MVQCGRRETYSDDPIDTSEDPPEVYSQLAREEPDDIPSGST